MPDPLLLPALGLLSALASPASAAEPSLLPPEAGSFELSYELGRTGDRLMVSIYAKNTSDGPVTVDDNPHVRAATLMVDAGTVVALPPPIDAEMFSRAGPMRRWITVKPGERLLVGTAGIDVPQGQPTDKGRLLLTVEAITPSGPTAQTAVVPLSAPGA